MEFVKKCS